MGKKLKSLFKRIFQFICYCDGVFGPDLNPGKPDCLIIPDFLVIDELNEASQEEINEIKRRGKYGAKA